ncbi:MAG: S-layer protein domain-containing protein [Methanosarcinales archaeon]
MEIKKALLKASMLLIILVLTGTLSIVDASFGDPLITGMQIQVKRGETLELKEDYVLRIIDVRDQDILLELDKDGKKIENYILSLDKTYTYTKKAEIKSDYKTKYIEHTIVSVELDDIFRGIDYDVVTLTINQYSEGAEKAVEASPTPTKTPTPTPTITSTKTPITPTKSSTPAKSPDLSFGLVLFEFLVIFLIKKHSSP